MTTETKVICPLRGCPVQTPISNQAGYLDMDCIKEKCGFWFDTSDFLLDFDQGCAITVMAHYLTKGGL